MDLLNQDRSMQFLQGLHESYSAFRSQILLREPLPPVNKMYSLLLQEKKQHAFSTSATPNLNEGHGGQKNCPRYHGDHFGRNGRTIQNCYKLYGFPPHSNNGPLESVQSQSHDLAASDQHLNAISTPSIEQVPAQITQDQHDQLLAILQRGRIDPATNFTGIALNSFNNDAWIIDSGATNHMCFTPNLLQSMSPSISHSKVLVANGSIASITQIGSTNINSKLHLDNVYLFPSFKFKLL
ncbi:hypothetical protein EZV62_004587 [Acer yangbiense]|uniref:PLD phosphodiesterase domain-containing protein n=1 Tax=Acer yangbiense TaxID=1000413 RepID=A0A5C7IM03_9ROSI|nr:hypothetical protein EZV62_004587 [Acer yangbiense]